MKTSPYLSPATGPAPGYFDEPGPCPACDGSGVSIHVERDYVDDGWGEGDMAEVDCAVCNGTGEVDGEDGSRDPSSPRSCVED